MSQRVVLAVNRDGVVTAIGPVANDKSIEQIRSQVEACGDQVRGVVRHLSWADFRAEVKRGPVPQGMPQRYRVVLTGKDGKHPPISTTPLSWEDAVEFAGDPGSEQVEVITEAEWQRRIGGAS